MTRASHTVKWRMLINYNGPELPAQSIYAISSRLFVNDNNRQRDALIKPGPKSLSAFPVVASATFPSDSPSISDAAFRL
jgi:hypothetical protein